MASRKKKGTTDDRKGSLGFEEKLWTAAALLRNNVDPAEYKHVVLGLPFFGKPSLGKLLELVSDMGLGAAELRVKDADQLLNQVAA